MTRPIRRLTTIIALAAGLLLAVPAAALAADVVPPRVSLQSGPAACELQAVLENFPAGTVTVRFSSTTHAAVAFPFTFTGEEGGSDRLLTSGPFVAGTWRASVGEQTSGMVQLPVECGPAAAAATPTPTTSQTSQDVLPFTGADPWPLATSGAALLILGAVALWHSRARRVGQGS